MNNLKKWLQEYSENAESCKISLDRRHIETIEKIANLNDIEFEQAAAYVIHYGLKKLSDNIEPLPYSKN